VSGPPPINIQAPAGHSLHERACQGDGAAFSALADADYRRGLAGQEPAIIAFAVTGLTLELTG
jgi:hypothetical protein